MDNNEKEILSSLLKRARKTHNLNQKDLAVQSGINVRNYQRIESGEISPKISTLLKIGNCLQLDFLHSYIYAISEYRSCPIRSIQSEGFKGWLTSKQRSLPQAIKLCEIAGFKKVLINNFNKNVKQIGYWEWNIGNGSFYWSPEMYVIYGLELDCDSLDEKFRLKIYKTDLSRKDFDLDLLVNFAIPYDNTHRVKHGQKLHRVRSQAKKFYNKNNDLIILGIAEKIEDH